MKKIVYASNKKAFHDYNIQSKNIYEAGLSLKGYEVKAIQAGKISIKESYISDNSKGSLVLKQSAVAIPSYTDRRFEDVDENRHKQLLLNKSEIKKIVSDIKVKGVSCIPLEVYRIDNGPIKLKIAVAAGKSNYDKRESLKKKDQLRIIQKEVKQRGNF